MTRDQLIADLYARFERLHRGDHDAVLSDAATEVARRLMELAITPGTLDGQPMVHTEALIAVGLL